VFIVRQGAAKMQPVTIEAIDGERASIATGLTDGDVVVTDGFDRLRDGSRVEITR
jgi:multidrug efflux pump subunit AcrA (membrane-fusion protein)